MSEHIARHLIIHGRVQGVWFRDWTVKTALELELTGWVRNMSNGTVEAHVEGELQSVERYIELAHKGPPAADVTGIDALDVAAKNHGSFEKRTNG